MQLQTPSSRALSVALQTAAKCINSKNTLAILDNVLLTQKDDKFFFTTATADSQLTIPAPLTLFGGKFDKSVTLPVDGLISYLSTLPECVVNITINDDHSLTLDYCLGEGEKVKTGKVSLTWTDADEFPLASPLRDDVLHITLPQQVLSTALDHAKMFSANDELRPVMNGLCIDITNDMSECIFVASDGHTLSKFIHTNDPKTGGSDFFRSGHPGSIILHKQYFRSLSAFAACETVDIESDGNTTRFTSGDIEFVCKAVEGRYPNYNSVIPKDNPFFLCFDKKEMLTVLKRVRIFGAGSNLVRIQKQGMFLNISAEDIDYATSASDQVIITESECKDGFAIGMNGEHIANAIAAIDSDDVRINLSDPTRAAVITANNPAPKILTLCMPMLLSE